MLASLKDVLASWRPDAGLSKKDPEAMLLDPLGLNVFWHHWYTKAHKVPGPPNTAAFEMPLGCFNPFPPNKPWIMRRAWLRANFHHFEGYAM